MTILFTHLIESMTNVRLAISIRWSIVQNKTLFSFCILPLPPEKLVKLTLLKNLQQKYKFIIIKFE